MAIPVDDVGHAAPIPAQRTATSPPPVLEPASGDVVSAAGQLVRAAVPTTADVVLGTLGWTLGAVRSATDVGVLAGHVALARLPIPGFLRSRARQAWRTAGTAGQHQRAEAHKRLSALLDVVVPEIVRTLLARIDLTALVGESLDLDRVAAGLDVDAVAARLDVDRVLDRIDLNEVADRIDVDRILDRVDLDEVAARLDVDKVIARVDLDGVVDRVDLDRAAARLDLDPILERADVVGLARYVIDAIDLPALIRSSTGSMTSEVVRGVRAQGADADEAVQRVVDRLLRRRGPRNDLAPGGER